MSGEYREIRVVVTTRDIDHWHPGWRRAAEAERADDYHGWLMRDLGDAIRKSVDAWAKAHLDELACEPDVIA